MRDNETMTATEFRNLVSALYSKSKVLDVKMLDSYARQEFYKKVLSQILDITNVLGIKYIIEHDGDLNSVEGRIKEVLTQSIMEQTTSKYRIES